MKKIFLISLLIFLPQAARAGFLDQPGLSCIISGSCGLDDVSTGIIYFIRMALGLMGATALLYFVWGGVKWLWSAGRSTQVAEGKNIMINTVFALFVAFGSYLLLDFFVNNVLGVKEEYTIDDQCSRNGTYLNRGVACGPMRACDGQGICLTLCEIEHNQDQPIDLAAMNEGPQPQEIWSCVYVTNPQSLPTGGGEQYYERNKCPGDEHYICMQLDTDGQPLLFKQTQ